MNKSKKPAGNETINKTPDQAEYAPYKTQAVA
jgi:hypothetical protein